MKIYNKFVESKKEPQNKNDIWFDGSSWKMYKEGMWRAFTLPLDVATIINNKAEKTDIVQSDWDQVKTNDKSYIQNKPFYDIIDRKLKVSDFTYDENEEAFVCDLVSLDNGYQTDCYTFKVYQDNNNGTDGVIIDSSIFKVGNYFSNTGSIFSDEVNFSICNNTFSVIVNVNVKYGEDNSCIIKISAYDEYDLEHALELLRWVPAYQDTVVVRPISNMYIPNTIARQSEIVRLENRIKELENKLK